MTGLVERINRIGTAYRHLGARFPGRSYGTVRYCFQRYIPPVERINRIGNAYRHLGARFPGRSYGTVRYCFQRYIPLVERINRIGDAYRHLRGHFPGRSYGTAQCCFRRYIPLGRLSRTIACAAVILLTAACERAPDPPAATARVPAPPSDPQHQGLTMPHGDHTPHHGGMVLMREDLHYEVVFDRGGRHRVWFTDAVRSDLPASVASKVTVTITRPDAPPEALELEIDDAGESWVASGQPVTGDNVTTMVTYVLDGTPYEIELPFFIPVVS